MDLFEHFCVEERAQILTLSFVRIVRNVRIALVFIETQRC